MVPRAGAAAELELYPVHVKLLRYLLTGQRQPNASMFAGMVGSIGGVMSSKQWIFNVVVSLYDDCSVSDATVNALYPNDYCNMFQPLACCDVSNILSDYVLAAVLVS